MKIRKWSKKKTDVLVNFYIVYFAPAWNIHATDSTMTTSLSMAMNCLPLVSDHYNVIKPQFLVHCRPLNSSQEINVALKWLNNSWENLEMAPFAALNGKVGVILWNKQWISCNSDWLHILWTYQGNKRHSQVVLLVHLAQEFQAHLGSPDKKKMEKEINRK